MSIVIQNISKSYQSLQAVDAISFEVKEGELFGLIGPDGAGKTTIFRMLTTLLIPSFGEAKVLGFDVVKEYKSIRNSVGYMPGKFSLYQDLTVETDFHEKCSLIFFGTKQAPKLEYTLDQMADLAKNVVERSVYRTNNPYVPVHDILLDPFTSPYRPQTRVRTQDRISTVTNIQPTVAKVVASGDNAPSAVHHVEITPPTPDFNQVQDFKVLSENFEMDLIKQALAASQFNQKKTAEALNLTYHQLRGYMKKYKLLDSQQ